MQASESEQVCTCTSCLADCSGHTQLTPATSWDIYVFIPWPPGGSFRRETTVNVQGMFAVFMVLIFIF